MENFFFKICYLFHALRNKRLREKLFGSTEHDYVNVTDESFFNLRRHHLKCLDIHTGYGSNRKNISALKISSKKSQTKAKYYKFLRHLFIPDEHFSNLKKLYSSE